MTSMTEKKTALQELQEHLPGRLDDFRDMLKRAESEDDEERENATQEMYEYPLGVSVSRVWRIDLSTGGPGDWLEIQVDDGEPQRIEYHFSPWFDHASVTLSGEDYEAAEAFARHITADFYEES